jgi:hypothetical protein
MSGTPQHECPFYRAARKRWPACSVQGSGRFAVWNKNQFTVALFDFQMSAIQHLLEQRDQKASSLFELTPDYGVPSGVSRPEPLRVNADRIERDRC